MYARNKPNTQPRTRISRRRMSGYPLAEGVTGATGTTFSSSIKLLPNVWKRLTNLAISHGEITGVPTGYSRLDQLTGGLLPSNLIIVAARPAMGKTAFALNIAMNAAVDNKIPVCVFSLESTKEQLIMRMLAARACVYACRFRRPATFSDEDWIRLAKAKDELSRAPLFIDDTPALSTLELCARIRQTKAEHCIGLVIVDSLQQLMRTNRCMNCCQLEIADTARSLRDFAKEMDIPIMVLSQLSRRVDKRANKRPILSDLRGPGDIGQAADVILFIYRDDVYNYQKPAERPLVGNAEIIIGKNRNGPVGAVKLDYNSMYITFEDKDC